MRKYLILIVILILAGILRLFNLASNPPGLTWDEAAFGYNAYSILLTGRDEYGSFLPINLKSFGDYKPALYAYIDIPFIALLGLNELAVRLPSALFGIGTVFLTFLLVLELFKNKPSALFSAFFMAISPLSIQFTRPGYEIGLALFLTMSGTLFFIKGLINQKLLILSAISFGLTLFTYQSSRLFTPLLIVSLLLIYRKQIVFSKYSQISIVVLTLFGILLLPTFFTGQANRLQAMNFFAYQRTTESVNLIAQEDGMNKDYFIFKILHGEWWSYTKGLAERYLIYFSPKLLFIEGDYNERHRVPDLGVFYYFSLILIPMGLINFIRKKGLGRNVLLAWFLLAPLPAILSRDLVQTSRAFNMVLPFVILEAEGFYFLFNRLKTSKIFYIAPIIILFLIFNFTLYLDRYFIHAPKEYSEFWLYGYKEIFTKLPDLQKYDRVIISDKYGQPYIYYLFYTKYPPAQFQKQAVLDQPTPDVGTVRKIDNLEFKHINISGDVNFKKTLIVDTFEEVPNNQKNNVRILKETKFLNGLPAFRIMETNEI